MTRGAHEVPAVALRWQVDERRGRVLVSLTAALLLVLLGMNLGLSGMARGEEPAGSGQALTKATPSTPTAGQLAPSPEFVLYGVIIVDHHRSALLTEPRFTEGRIRRVVLGAQVGPYRVSRIEADGVLLETDGLALRVPLGGSGWGPAPAALAGAPLGGPDARRAAAPVEAARGPAPDPAAMWQLSRDLGIPVRTLEAQAVETQLEPVELLLAHRLARESKLSLEELVVEFRRRRAWGAIIERYAVDREKLVGQMGEFLRATEGSSASRPARASR